MSLIKMALVAPVVPMVWLLAQAGSNEPPPPSLPFENMGQVWLALILLAGTIFTHVMGSRREAKAREWLIEDRKAALVEAEKTAARIRTDLLHEAEAIKREAWERTDSLSTKIDENTRISADAVKAANDVNNKIASVGGMRLVQDAQKQRRPGDEQPSHERRADDPLPIPPTRREEDEQ